MSAVEDLIEVVRQSESSNFYRSIWDDARSFAHLPVTSRSDFLRVPLSERRYKDGNGLVKVVHDGAGMFLSEWEWADIGKEHYAERSERPLVYMSDPHAAIELSMWCYENDMLPLIGEKDADVAAYAASRYEIDSLITDPDGLERISAKLAALPRRLDSITIIASSFDTLRLEPHTGIAESVRLLLALPETGALAFAPFAAKPNFSPVPGCVIETSDTLIVTKLSLLVTPVIKYRTAIPSSLYDGS